MGLFDKLFKKNAFDRKMDEAFDSFVENNPITRKTKETIAGAQEEITRSLEEELYGEARQGSVNDESEDDMMRRWGTMIDQLIDKELNAYKVCPNCCEAVPAEKENCPYCGTKLPETTAAVQICPHCGAENKILDRKCANCGKNITPGTDTTEPSPM